MKFNQAFKFDKESGKTNDLFLISRLITSLHMDKRNYRITPVAFVV